MGFQWRWSGSYDDMIGWRGWLKTRGAVEVFDAISDDRWVNKNRWFTTDRTAGGSKRKDDPPVSTCCLQTVIDEHVASPLT